MPAAVRFLKKEAVLLIAAVCACVTMIFVHPDRAYAGYMDIRVLCLLFCLMLVVAGLQECGLFIWLAKLMLSGEKNLRLISLSLVLLPFICSMFITNDVALITFVPFTILVLEMSGKPSVLIWLTVLQTAAANLGSMMMPVGNPQNLYLYGRFGISAGNFFGTMLPFTLVSLVLLGLLALFVPGETISISLPEEEGIRNPRKLLLFLGLFVLCLLSVFHVLNYGVLLVIVLAAVLAVSRGLLRQADYSLLLTFVFFFVFAGNVGRMEAVRVLLTDLLSANAVLTSAAASQIISNVPAAVLLSGFTDNWKGLLIGTNIGGLGTPIASLASLISLKFYLRTSHARPGKYFAVFMAVNVSGLLILYGVYRLLQ